MLLATDFTIYLTDITIMPVQRFVIFCVHLRKQV